MLRSAPRRTFQFLLLLGLLCGLVPAALPTIQSPSAAHAAVSAACANAAMNGTWNADVNLNYSKQAADESLEVTHNQSGNAGITFELASNPIGNDVRVWQAMQVSGSGSVETREVRQIPGQGEQVTTTSGSGAVQLSFGTFRLNPVTCRYDLNLWLWINATTTHPDGSTVTGPASVLHFDLFNIPLDASASGGPIPTLSGAANPPARLVDVEPNQDMFWMAESADEINTLLRNQGATDAGSAAVDWVIRPPRTGPHIVEIEFRHQEVPSERWVRASGQRGTVDGNYVLIVAKINNPLGTIVQLPVRFYDDETNELLPECNETETLRPTEGEPEEITCLWDTEGWAWDAASGGNPPRQHPNHRIRVELGATTNLLDLVKAPFVVRPKPVIFVHGLNSNDKGWSKYPGFLRQANDYWEGYAVPGLKTGDGIGSQQESVILLQNAKTMHEYIERVRALENAWHIDIVAHSMGGLISRQYIHSFMPQETPDQRPVAKHLVMLGTPNQGSDCATVQFALALKYGLPNLIAPAELMPSSVARFNQHVTNQHGVHFSVLAGNSLSKFVCNPQTIPNDLVVTVPSAHYIYSDIGFTSRNHIEMTGSLADFVAWVLPHLAKSRDDIGLQAVQRSPELTTEAAPLQLGQTASGAVPAGGEVSVPLQIPAVDEVSVLFIAAPGVRVSLRDPSGAEVDVSPAGDPQLLRGFQVNKPTAGSWTLHAVSQEAAATSIYATVAVSGGDLQFTGQFVDSGENGMIAVTATLQRQSAVSDATVSGSVLHSDGTTQTISLHDDGAHHDGAAGDGVYGATLSAAPEVLAVAIRASIGDNEHTIVLSPAALPATEYRIFLPLLQR